MKSLEIVGQKFNQLLCIEKVESVKKHSCFIFLCDCGEKVRFMGTLVKKGYRTRCNVCARQTTKKYRDHPLYDVWKGMKARCRDKKHIGYKIYGGRGVKVCEEWEVDFFAFYNWCMANGWQHGMDIDKDSKGDGLLYSPETCCIISGKENSRRTRATKLDYDKVKDIRDSKLSAKELAYKYNVHVTTIYYVLKNKLWN